jgi:hypothetical protein
VESYFHICSVAAVPLSFPRHLSHIIPSMSPIIVDVVVVFIMWWIISGVITIP